jgi:hypothetical protein
MDEGEDARAQAPAGTCTVVGAPPPAAPGRSSRSRCPSGEHRGLSSGAADATSGSLDRRQPAPFRRPGGPIPHDEIADAPLAATQGRDEVDGNLEHPRLLAQERDPFPVG